MTTRKHMRQAAVIVPLLTGLFGCAVLEEEPEYQEKVSRYEVCVEQGSLSLDDSKTPPDTIVRAGSSACVSEYNALGLYLGKMIFNRPDIHKTVIDRIHQTAQDKAIGAILRNRQSK